MNKAPRPNGHPVNSVDAAMPGATTPPLPDSLDDFLKDVGILGHRTFDTWITFEFAPSEAGSWEIDPVTGHLSLLVRMVPTTGMPDLFSDDMLHWLTNELGPVASPAIFARTFQHFVRELKDEALVKFLTSAKVKEQP